MYTNYWYKRTFGAENLSTVQLKTTVIGNDVWVGSNVVILGGLNIGDGAIIGAGAVVTKDVQPYSIVVGNPAREIKKRFSEQIISSLMAIRWWEFPPELLAKNVDVLNRNVDEELIHILREIKDEFEIKV